MPLWETDRNRSDDTLSLKISCCNAARTIRGGDFSTLWRLCIESPSQPKLASSLHNKRLSYWRLTGCGRNDGDGGSVFYNLRPLKGKRLTTFCASLRSGGPPIGGQDSDGVSNRRSALYTLCLFEAFTHREACHWIRGSLLSPMNPVPLPPQGETRSMERKNRESYISCTTPTFPLWWLSPPPFPRKRWHYNPCLL